MKGALAIATLILLNVASLSVVDASDLKLVILHTNDMHSRFEETSAQSGKCLKSLTMCYGGFARLKRAVDDAKRKIAEEGMQSIFLNAGDTFQGTVYYSLFKWRVVAKFMNKLGIDVMSLGNHEFDDGVPGLAPFIRNVSIPIVTSNIDVTKEPTLQQPNLTPSKVLTVAGRQIGIIGYLTPDTKFLSSTGNVVFEDEVSAIRRESEKLRDRGVNIIIAVGHSGYPADKRIAEHVPEVDVVVGAHTNTFLYTGKPPDSEVPEGPYPTIVTQPSGKKVPVVQAYAYTKYLGYLKVVFNDDGDVTVAEGNPILLDRSHAEDPEILAELGKFKAGIDEKSQQEIGVTKVVLLGDTPCRLDECNFGNMITDAMVDYNTRMYVGRGWTDAPIAITQGGSIRTTLDLGETQGVITYGDLLTAMPFENALERVTLKGNVLLAALEWSVFAYDHQKRDGRFLQFSGIRVTYDVSAPPGSRVVSVKVRCGNCTIPQYSPLNASQDYTVIMSAYLSSGGDGYDMFQNSALKKIVLGDSDTTVVQEYLKKYSPVYPETDKRITFIRKGNNDNGQQQKPTGGSNAFQETMTQDFINFHKFYDNSREGKVNGHKFYDNSWEGKVNSHKFYDNSWEGKVNNHNFYDNSWEGKVPIQTPIYKPGTKYVDFNQVNMKNTHKFYDELWKRKASIHKFYDRSWDEKAPINIQAHKHRSKFVDRNKHHNGLDEFQKRTKIPFDKPDKKCADLEETYERDNESQKRKTPINMCRHKCNGNKHAKVEKTCPHKKLCCY